jgi:hypothetical protein
VHNDLLDVLLNMRNGAVVSDINSNLLRADSAQLAAFNKARTSIADSLKITIIDGVPA